MEGAYRGTESVVLYRDLGKDIHALDLSSHSKFRTVIFHPDHSGLAADPTLLPRCEFGRENEYELDVSSLFHLGICIQEHSVRANVSRLRRDLSALLGTQTRGYFRDDSSSASTLIVGLHTASKCPHTVHQEVPAKERLGGE